MSAYPDKLLLYQMSVFFARLKTGKVSKIKNVSKFVPEGKKAAKRRGFRGQDSENGPPAGLDAGTKFACLR